MLQKMMCLFAFSSLILLSACQNLMNENPLVGQWRIESIQKGGIIDFSMITLQIDAEQRISGSTGCNNFTGGIQTHNQKFEVDNIAHTRKLCAPALNAQEQRFTSALETASSYKEVEHGWIYVFDEDNNRILKLVPMTEKVANEQTSSLAPSNAKLDASAPASAYFQCEQIGRVSMRFLGPETIELTLNNEAHVMSRNVSASGAKYSKQNMSFWNKGQEAVLTLKQIRHSCSKLV